MAFTKNRDEPIYTISVAARLVRPLPKTVQKDDSTRPIHAQTLRMYDRLGLVKPQKVGRNRFYSDRDIERLQQIQHWTQDIGINLAGVTYLFALLEHVQKHSALEADMDALLRDVEAQIAGLLDKTILPGTEVSG